MTRPGVASPFSHSIQEASSLAGSVGGRSTPSDYGAMDLGLQGKRAIVVGGTRGIGRAIVDLLAAEGCSVGLCARTADQVAATVAELEGRGGGVAAFGRVADAGDPAALRSFVDEAAGALGGLDVYVANASGALGMGNDEVAWRRGVEVDILGTVAGCEAAVPHLEAAGGGAIVVVSTVSAVEIATPRRAYNSVKAALHPYVKALARDLGPVGVRANLVSPGQILFDGGIWDVARQNAPERFADALARNPLGRLGTPEEVAATVVFAASPVASFVSGANLVCDGARTQNVF